jgi:hypothetical protein
MFDKMGVRVTESGDRRETVLIDAEGDQIFETFDSEGTFRYVRGTGKYAGGVVYAALLYGYIGAVQFLHVLRAVITLRVLAPPSYANFAKVGTIAIAIVEMTKAIPNHLDLGMARRLQLVRRFVIRALRKRPRQDMIMPGAMLVACRLAGLSALAHYAGVDARLLRLRRAL